MVGIDSWWDARVRDRSEAILELVINAIANGPESLELILKCINEEYPAIDSEKTWPAESAIPVSRGEIINALRDLTREGYAQASDFGTQEHGSKEVEFRGSEIDDLWFDVTAKGKSAVERLCERDSGNS